MSLTTAKLNFESYLLSPIERYPVAAIPFSLKPRQDHRKELIFQQSLFLQVADKLHTSKPWVTYFATTKHFRLLTAKDISTATFNDLRDKEFATEVAATAERLRDSAAAKLDRETINNLDYLCQLQEVSPLASIARDALAAIVSSKYHQTVLRVASGESMATGCATFVVGVVLCGVGLGLIDSISSSNGGDATVAIPYTIAILGVIIACFQYLKWEAVTTLVARYRSDIVPVAEIVGADPLDWLARPAEAQSYLAQLDSIREEFEQTYLDVSE